MLFRPLMAFAFSFFALFLTSPTNASTYTFISDIVEDNYLFWDGVTEVAERYRVVAQFAVEGTGHFSAQTPCCGGASDYNRSPGLLGVYADILDNVVGFPSFDAGIDDIPNDIYRWINNPLIFLDFSAQVSPSGVLENVSLVFDYDRPGGIVFGSGNFGASCSYAGHPDREYACTTGTWYMSEHIAPIPAPAGLVLLGSALMAMGLYRARRRRIS